MRRDLPRLPALDLFAALVTNGCPTTKNPRHQVAATWKCARLYGCQANLDF